MEPDILTPVENRRRDGAPVWAYFDRRVRTPREARAPLPLRPVSGPQGALEAALDAPSSGPRVAYVHVPFCRSLCRFCGYHRRVPSGPEELVSHATAVVAQARDLATRPWTRSRPLSALHLGGGTPTVLGGEVLAGLVRSLREALPLEPDAEITI
jgi:oxygen-independent coproporphyrinogen-3 oxidase